GHVGRYGSGVQPLRGQNNVQGGGDMGALPNRLPGFQLVADDALRAKFDAAWGAAVPPEEGRHLSGMFEAMEHGELRTLYVIGENPAQSEADQARAERLLSNLDTLVVQDLFLTKTAQLADVVLPASACLGESEGTVTSSERRVQRVRKAFDPPGEARDDIEIVYELGRRLGHDLGSPRAEDVWNELRTLSPMHAGMSYERLEELGGIQWPCPDDSHPGTQFLHGRLWDEVVEQPAAFQPVLHSPPVDVLDDDFPLRLTTGRRLESFNTGVQTNGFSSPLHVGGEALLLAPEDGRRYGIVDGGRARIVSRRDRGARPLRRRPAPRPRVHEPALPRPRRDERADDRRDRPEIRHRRVQGRGDSRGSAVVDLKLLTTEPTAEERTAIDAVVGVEAVSGTRIARSYRDGRHLLLPALRAAQRRVGYVSEGALGYVARRLEVPPADAYGVATFYALLALEPREPDVLHVCTDLACRLHGAVVPEGAHPSPCLGLCERAPAAYRTVAGTEPREEQIPAVGPPLPQAGERGLRLLRRMAAGL